MKTALAALAATLALAATPAAADVILDTGAVTPFEGGLSIGGQWVAVRFTVDRPTMVTDVEGYLVRLGDSPSLTFALRDEVGGAPGERLFSAVGDVTTTPDWQGLRGLRWTVGPGAYWLGFESPGATFDGVIGSPLRIAPFATGFPPLAPYTVADPDFFGAAVRIAGDAAVPEPGTWALLVLGFGVAGAALRRRRGGPAVSPRRLAALAALASVAVAGSAQADVILDTGAAPPVGFTGVQPDQWVGVRFEVSNPTVVTDVEGYLGRISGENALTFAIREGDALPGAEVFSAVGALGTPFYEWHGLHGLSWRLPAGAYWLTFEVRPGQTFEGAIAAALNLAPTAIALMGPGPIWLPEPDPRLGAAVRINGFAAPVPETGTWALLILGFGVAGAGLRRRARAAPLLAGAALSAVAALPAAAATYGSASWVTSRSCASVTATDPCDGEGPGQAIFAQDRQGGLGREAFASLELPSGAFAKGAVTFGALDLPVIRGSASAVGDVRMNSNNVGFQSFVYAGAAPSAFSLSGEAHIVDSSTDAATGLLPLGGLYSAYLAILDPASVGGLATPADIFTTLYGAGCGVPGVLAAAFSTAPLLGGEARFGLSTVSCSGSPLVLSPGDEVLTVAGFQIPTNRGGFIDASHTFTVGLDTALPKDVRANLERSLVSAASAAPEPAQWALLILGFGLAGLALRRRGSPNPSPSEA